MWLAAVRTICTKRPSPPFHHSGRFVSKQKGLGTPRTDINCTQTEDNAKRQKSIGHKQSHRGFFRAYRKACGNGHRTSQSKNDVKQRSYFQDFFVLASLGSLFIGDYRVVMNTHANTFFQSNNPGSLLSRMFWEFHSANGILRRTLVPRCSGRTGKGGMDNQSKFNRRQTCRLRLHRC